MFMDNSKREDWKKSEKSGNVEIKEEESLFSTQVSVNSFLC